MTQPKEHPITIAAFDFDGTITYKDSLFPFLLFTHGYAATLWKLLLLAPWLIGFLLEIVARQKVKEQILYSFYAGKPLEEIKKLGKEFACNKMDALVRPEALDRISWHLKQGHQCLIISASIDLYLAPWAEKTGLHHTLSSKLETNTEGCITGKLIGLNCWGPEKVRRLEEACGPRDGYTLYAYGDSRGDKNLLAIADFPYYRTMS